MIETTYLYPMQGGRVGMIVPHGALFQRGAEGRIRQQLIEENLLDSVIGLPENLFYGTGIPAAILIFQHDKRDNPVLFIDASREFEQGTIQNRLRGEDRAKIVEAYKARQFVDQYAYVAAQDEIAENDYNLNIPRYVDIFEPEPPVDMAAVNAEIRDLRGQLSDVEAQMQAYLRELGLDG